MRKWVKYGVGSDYAVEKNLKRWTIRLFKDTYGYVGRIDEFDSDGELKETYFVAERKSYGCRVGGFAFVPHYNDMKKHLKKTLDKVWLSFLRGVSKLGYPTMLLGQPDIGLQPWRQ